MPANFIIQVRVASARMGNFRAEADPSTSTGMTAPSHLLSRALLQGLRTRKQYLQHADPRSEFVARGDGFFITKPIYKDLVSGPIVRNWPGASPENAHASPADVKLSRLSRTCEIGRPTARNGARSSQRERSGMSFGLGVLQAESRPKIACSWSRTRTAAGARRTWRTWWRRASSTSAPLARSAAENKLLQFSCPTARAL